MTYSRVAATRDYDAIVVGAGSAGGASALALARTGKRVLLLEQRPLGEAGARWVNALPPWMYDAASIDRPRSPELRHSARFLIHAGDSKKRICIDPAPTRQIDVRKLCTRLQDLARAAGVEIRGSSRLLGERIDRSGRLTHLSVQHADGDFEASARLFVDASGLNASLRRRVARLARDTPKVETLDLCTAAQYVHHIHDPEGARRFMHRNDLRAGDTLCTIGAYGGFSTANLAVEPEQGEAEILTGSIADGVHLNGPQIVEAMLKANPWIGDRIFGGAGAIPIRRPYDRLAGAGVALVGNSACQVFPAHGSGTGISMIAARVLARAVAKFRDPGSEEALWAYQAQFHRQWGGLLAFYDLVRRHSQTLSKAALTELFDAGILTPASQRAALDQRVPRPSVSEVLRMFPGLGRRGARALELARALGPGPAVWLHHANYPAEISESRLRAWSRRGAWLRGDRPDLFELS